MISNDGKFRTVWNIVMVIFIIYIAIYGPYRIAFTDESESLNLFSVLDVIIDIFFLAEIIITFLTDY